MGSFLVFRRRIIGAIDLNEHEVRRVIGLRPGVRTYFTMQMLLLPERQLFICDTHINPDPSAEQIAEMTLLAAEQVRRFGITPSVALLSHSSFGSSDAPSAQKMRAALELVRAAAPDLAVEGEMRADQALSAQVREGLALLRRNV